MPVSLLSSQVEGASAIDEAVWEYYGRTPYKIFIPRKPKDTGIRAYLHCFELKHSGLPVCYRLLPDTRVPKFSPEEVLRSAVEHLPKEKEISITTDSAFGSLYWLN